MNCMQALGKFSRNISASSTHYQQLASLASQYPGTFQNLHGSAEIGAGGSLRYDYVLNPAFQHKCSWPIYFRPPPAMKVILGNIPWSPSGLPIYFHGEVWLTFSGKRGIEQDFLDRIEAPSLAEQVSS